MPGSHTLSTRRRRKARQWLCRSRQPLGGQPPARPQFGAVGRYMIALGLGIGLITHVMVLVPQNGASYADLGAATGAVNLAGRSALAVGVVFIHRLH